MVFQESFPEEEKETTYPDFSRYLESVAQATFIVFRRLSEGLGLLEVL